MVSSVYLRLLMFLSPILIPSCNSSNPAFLMMCSAFRLNQQGNSRQPRHTSFSILNQSVVPHRVFIVAFWPTYRFLGRQVSWSTILISLTLSIDFMNHTVKGFSIVNKEVDFFWYSIAFSMIQQMLAIWSLIPFLNPLGQLEVLGSHNAEA